MVGAASEAAQDALEVGLRLPIGTGNMPARRTGLTGVSRIDIHHWHSSEACLVIYEPSELRECPVGQSISLSAPGRYPRANPLQLFEGDGTSGALRRIDDVTRDHVVLVALEALLLASDSAQLPRGGAGLFPLKVSTTVAEGAGNGFKSSPIVGGSIRIDGKVDDTKVDAEHVRYGKHVGFWHVTHDAQEPLATNVQQIDFPLTVGEPLSLVVPQHDWQLHPTFNGPEIDPREVGAEPENAVVVGLPSGRSETSLNFPIRLVGVRDLGNTADGHLRGQSEAVAGGAVGGMVQGVLAEHFRPPRRLSDSGAGSVGLLQRCTQDLGLLTRNGQPDIDNYFHGSSIDLLPNRMQPEKERRFLPGLKARGLHAED